ncbi:TetR/AcrR family transcriptional regulator [Kribbella yunnanensis]|uniref:TetR/AcrR family transcriptional regulator n=1 Tax=Kribbella yunnanensis TaxID=190194 RepID=A0ABN2IWR3_9ACTN
MTLDNVASSAPRRGTRPRNRRTLIVAAAADLFFQRGFDQIGMSDIADAVSIGPSALYRHFSGKQDLLYEVIRDGLAPIRGVVESLDLRDRKAALSRLAGLALDRRQLGVLWQREARQLSGDNRELIRAEVRAIGRLVADRVRVARPDLPGPATVLLGWALLSVFSSSSFHHLNLPRAQYEELLSELFATVLDSPVAEIYGERPAGLSASGISPRSRREALLAKAIQMFADHGYMGVGIEDIGAAVGIAGPSIYNHFPTKRDLLVTALERAAAVLFMDLAAVYADAADPAEALSGLIRSYVEFTMQHHGVVGLMITEQEHLPERLRATSRQTQHDYVSEWVQLYLELNPDQDPIAARIRIQAALSIANDLARTPRLRLVGLEETVGAICRRLLMDDQQVRSVKAPGSRSS